MKTWTRHSTVVLIVLIAVLLPVLAFFQFHWLDELSRLEQEHRSDNLRAAAVRFSVDFDAELARIYQAFHVREALLAEAEAELARGYAEWTASVVYPELIEAVYWVEVFETQETRLQKLDVDNAQLVPVEWPEQLEGMRDTFSTPGNVDPLHGDVPALVVFQHGTEPLPWAVVVLDALVLSRPYLAARVEQFSGGSPIAFDAMLVDIENEDEVIYTSNPRLTGEEFRAYEEIATIALFGLHPRDFRFEWIEALPTGATDHRWRLYLRHQPGALAAAVGAMRTRNLILSFGILLLLAGSILVLLFTTRRSQRWAQLQLEYVARIAHELRTPLSVIGFASENLADDVVPEPERVRTYGQVIRKESKRLSKLVESALLHSRLESGAARDMERQPVQIMEIIDAALNDSEIAPSQVKVDLEQELPPVVGDVAALKSALQNLFSNAVKYGGPTCNLSVSVKSTGASTGSGVEIEIEDHGPGISAADLPHIFEPFYRGKGARDEQIEGSGIGLSLVKHVVDAHGGTIRVSSPETGGSRFTVRLPASA